MCIHEVEGTIVQMDFAAFVTFMSELPVLPLTPCALQSFICQPADKLLFKFSGLLCRFEMDGAQALVALESLRRACSPFLPVQYFSAVSVCLFFLGVSIECSMMMVQQVS